MFIPEDSYQSRTGEAVPSPNTRKLLARIRFKYMQAR